MEIFKIINLSLIQDQLQIEKNDRDLWIIYGLNGYLADQFRSHNENEYQIYISKLFHKLNKWVIEGREFFPISEETDNQEFFKFITDKYTNEFYMLKCRIVIHMISSIANCKKTLCKILFQKIDEVYSTEKFIKKIKISFGIKKIKYFVKQFIQSTGVPNLLLSYSYSRKENKLYFNIEQKPLQEDFYKKQNDIRCELESLFYKDISEPLKTLKDSNKTPIPEISRSLNLFSGRLQLVVSETNEIDYKEEVHSLFVDKKKENKAVIVCRVKFRKTIHKKYGGNDDDHDRSEINPAPSSTQHENEARKLQLFTFNNQARNPALWVKIDTEHEFLNQIQIKQPENILLLQLTKEKDAGTIYNILESLEQFNTITTVNTLSQLIEQKVNQMQVIFYLITDLRKNDKHELFNYHKKNNLKDIDNSIKVLIAKWLLKISSPNTGWRGLDLMLNILKKNCLDQDNNTVKYNDFSKENEYLLNLAIIKRIVKVKDQIKSDNQSYVGQNIIEILLKLLKENDNSNNKIDDSYYRSQLIKSLLQCNNPKYQFKILEEILLQLKIEISINSYDDVVLLTVLNGFSEFLISNKIYLSNSNKNMVQLVDEIQKILKLLVNHSCPNISSNYLIFELKFQESYHQSQPQELIIFAIQKIELLKSLNISVNIIEAFSNGLLHFVQKRQHKFQSEMQKNLTSYQNEKITQIVWEQLTSGLAFINPIFRSSLMLIYRLLYFHWVPISTILADKRQNYFQMDLEWLKEEIAEQQNEQQGKHYIIQQIYNNIFNHNFDILNSIHQLATVNTVTNIINLRHLNLNKRRRVQVEKTKLNPRDTLLQFYKNCGVEYINWKTLARSILGLLLSEKLTEKIEKEYLNDEIETFDSTEQQNQSNHIYEQNGANISIKIKIKTPLSLKFIRKQLIREYYENLDQVEEEIYECINNYKKNDFMSEEAFNEYTMLVDCLFQEARKILKEKALGKIHFKTGKINKFKIKMEGDQVKFDNGEKERQQKLMEMERNHKKPSTSIKLNLKNL